MSLPYSIKQEGSFLLFQESCKARGDALQAPKEHSIKYLYSSIIVERSLIKTNERDIKVACYCDDDGLWHDDFMQKMIARTANIHAIYTTLYFNSNLNGVQEVIREMKILAQKFISTGLL